jgi:hypothetical protein
MLPDQDMSAVEACIITPGDNPVARFVGGVLAKYLIQRQWGNQYQLALKGSLGTVMDARQSPSAGLFSKRVYCVIVFSTAERLKR